MGETSLKAISAIALIIGAVTFSWFAYDQLFVPETSSSRQYYGTDLYASRYIPASGYHANNILKLEFTVYTGEKVYFSYVSTLTIDDSSAPDTSVTFRFEVDGIMLSYPFCYISRYNDDGGAPDGRYVSVALQHYNTTIPAGTHEVTVVFQGDSTADSVKRQTLFVQVFK